MSEEIDTLRQQLVLAGKYGQNLLIENNEVNSSSGLSGSRRFTKVGCAFPMVISSDFRMGQHRDDQR